MLDFKKMSSPISQAECNQFIHNLLYPDHGSQESSDLDIEYLNAGKEKFRCFQKTRRGGIKIFSVKNETFLSYNIISMNRKKELLIGKCVKNKHCSAKIYLNCPEGYIKQEAGKRSTLDESVLNATNLDILSSEDHKCSFDQSSLNEEIFGWMKTKVSDTYISLATPHLVKETLTILAIEKFGSQLVRRAAIKDMIAFTLNSFSINDHFKNQP